MGGASGELCHQVAEDKQGKVGAPAIRERRKKSRSILAVDGVCVGGKSSPACGTIKRNLGGKKKGDKMFSNFPKFR